MPTDRPDEPESQDDEKARKRAEDGTGELPIEDTESWLKDSARARDVAGFGPLLERAIGELLGSAGWKAGGERSGVWITGDVHVKGDMLGGDKHVGTRSSAYIGEVI